MRNKKGQETSDTVKKIIIILLWIIVFAMAFFAFKKFFLNAVR